MSEAASNTIRRAYAIHPVTADRFDAIERRIVLVLNQLDVEQVNWHPNESSNSITNLIIHINGNINERIGKGINHKPFTRDRDKEFEAQFKTKVELIEMIQSSLGVVKVALMTLKNEQFSEVQQIGNREQTNLEMFIQSATHFSEHNSVPNKKPL
nr:DUF1572 family protein [Paenibacillus cremeus]